MEDGPRVMLMTQGITVSGLSMEKSWAGFRTTSTGRCIDKR